MLVAGTAFAAFVFYIGSWTNSAGAALQAARGWGQGFWPDLQARLASGDLGQDSRSPVLDLYIMGGRPIREPVAHYGPFVMNTRDELVKAFDDYQAGRLGTIPADQLR